MGMRAPANDNGIGSYRHRVEVWALSSTKDEGGAAVSAYTRQCTRWMLVEDLKGYERMLAASTRERITGRIRLRYYPGLDAKYRFKYGEVYFEILGVTNPDGRKVEHVCDVVALKGPL